MDGLLDQKNLDRARYIVFWNLRYYFYLMNAHYDFSRSFVTYVGREHLTLDLFIFCSLCVRPCLAVNKLNYQISLLQLQ